MAIGNAVQRGDTIYIYNEKLQLTGIVTVGAPPPSGLTGYTSGSVNVRRGSTIFSFGERGQLLGTTPAG